MGAAAQELAQHQRRPAFGEDLGTLGDRAELAISAHRSLLLSSLVASLEHFPAKASPGLDPGCAAFAVENATMYRIWTAFRSKLIGR
jgi:hypothetical protein